MSNSKTQRKPCIAVVYGGRSGEHEVSIDSARAIIDALDKDRYDVLPLHIGKDGVWRKSNAKQISEPHNEQVRLLPQEGSGGLLRTADHEPAERIDMVFPIVHGTLGEDGSLQGLFELLSIPYIGCSVLGSAVGMDKVVQKRILRDADIPVTPWVDFSTSTWKADKEELLQKIEKKIGYPHFVKPVNGGSSVGISKAHDRVGLLRAITLAQRYDTRVVVESAVPNARELECSALGNENHAISVFSEIFPGNEFYDYAAKYLDDTSKTAIPADIPPALQKKLTITAQKACNDELITCAAGKHAPT